MRQKIVIFGSQGHASLVIDVIEVSDEYEIFGIIDPNVKEGSRILGYPVLGDESKLKSISKKGIKKGIIAIGDNFIRRKVSEKIINIIADFEFVTVIHPNAVISPKTDIGKGSLFLAGSIVNRNAKIGEHCIVHTNTVIEHDVKLNDYVGTSPSATLGGSVEVGYCSFVGMGANILHNVKIGDFTVVGAGSLVTKNLEKLGVYYGTPAKLIRVREEDETYY